MIEIELRNIIKEYVSGPAATRAVDDVSATIAPGEFFFLLGPSGCGKTTLLRIIAGLIDPTAGSVLLGGRDVTHLPVEKRNTAMVFQNYALWPHMTVQANVEFGPRMKGLGADHRRDQAAANLTRVQMQEYSARRPNQLSGGQQQRVALARALAAGSDCLLLDEPLSNLDARLRLHMRGELRRLVKSTGATAVYVTHDQKEALSMADRIAVMNQGKIVQIGAPRRIYDRPATRFVADFLGEANFIAGAVVAAGPPARIETELGTLLAADGASTAQSQVLCCVRPEHIRLVAGGEGEAKSAEGFALLPATIESDMFLGEIHQYSCRVGKDLWKVTSLSGDAMNAAPGQKVLLKIDAKNVAVLME